MIRVELKLTFDLLDQYKTTYTKPNHWLKQKLETQNYFNAKVLLYKKVISGKNTANKYNNYKQTQKLINYNYSI